MLNSGLLAGLLVGRWWAILLTFPAGVFAATRFDIEGFSDVAFGMLSGFVFAVGVVVGVVLGKGFRAAAPGKGG